MMKKVYSNSDQAAIAIVRDLLAQQGIESKVLNENTAAVLGEIPFLHATPEVWVRDEDRAQALTIVERFESGETRESMARPAWTCPQCNEQIAGQFTECWNCVEPADPQDEP